MKRLEFKNGDNIGPHGLVFIKEVQQKNKRRRCDVRCTCGAEFEVMINSAKSGRTRSCGCYHKKVSSQLASKLNKSHGLSKHPLYTMWKNMVLRCHNKKATNYHDYGGKGIRVCDRWRQSFEEFFCWANSSGWKAGLEIDRIENSSGYSPENCRFVTREIQARNKGVRKNSTTGITGVTFNKLSNKYAAAIGFKGKRIHLGYFDKIEDAKAARKKAESEFWQA